MPSSTSSTDRGQSSIAVDFGGTKISAAQISKRSIVKKRQLETVQDAAPETHLQSIISLIEALDVEGQTNLGVAVSGRVDRRGYWHTMNHKTFRGFSEFPLRDKLQAHFGRPVNVMNDAVAAAWGEYSCLPRDENIDSLLYITVSTGVGGGVVLNGRPLVSEDGLAGHIGFMTSTLASDHCGSGRFATIESVASGTAMGRTASAESGKHLSGYDVFQAHLSGDESATAVVETSARAIAKAIADVRALLGVQLATIGGSVGLADGYIALVRQHLEEEPPLFQPRVIPAMLCADSALVGVTLIGNDDNSVKSGVR